MDDKIEQIFTRFHEDNPSPQIELDSVNNFTFLVAVALSARATDVQVNKVTAKLFADADTPEKMYELGEDKIREYITSLTLFNAKAKNVYGLCKMLIKDFNSEVPENVDDLLKLPGVGVKTANLYVNHIHGAPNIAVDTHVFRVVNRLGIVNEENDTKTEAALAEVVPDKWKVNAHLWLILHGRYICKAQNPKCSECMLQDLCSYKGNEND